MMEQESQNSHLLLKPDEIKMPKKIKRSFEKSHTVRIKGQTDALDLKSMEVMKTW